MELLINSGYVVRFARRPRRNATPGVASAPGNGVPSAWSGYTIVASIATGSPRVVRSPEATTSMCLSSAGSMFGTAVSRRYIRSLTRTPVSRITRAHIRSTGVDLSLSLPERWHAAA